MAKTALLAALAAFLMTLEIPLPFAPSFYQIDLSEVPVLLGGFALGPAAALCIELLKNLLYLLFKGTITAGVGELANFLIGLSLVLPASLLYRKKKSRKGALWGLLWGTLAMTAAGVAVNYFVLLPAYSFFMGIPLSALVDMGSAANSSITSLGTLVIFATLPFNLLKGALSSLITLLLYKRLSPLLHR
ncbi:ECF transporter S component [Intestinimonas butyriciproducens]|nr:ECF transporter S component [Intestinimonas butyriciproducens]